jgi:hypothetical protein
MRCTALIMASRVPERIAGVFFFACNMDPNGAKPITGLTPILRRRVNRHRKIVIEKNIQLVVQTVDLGKAKIFTVFAYKPLP